MIDRDDDAIARRYRELAHDEPPAALDDAILAASRRAVHARPSPWKRWSGPVSIAAVLVLAVGVVTRMQVEQPGVETSVPQRQAPVPAAPKAEPPAQPASPEATKPDASTAVQPQASTLAKDSFAARREESPAKSIAPARKASAPTPAQEAKPVDKRETVAAPMEAAPAAPAPMQAPAVATTQEPAPPPIMVQSTTPPPQPPSAMSPATSNSQAARPAADASAAGAVVSSPARPMTVPQSTSVRAKSMADRAAATTPEGELERIARLRTEGKDDEADRALEAFRRAYPEFRIEDAMWERVKRRTP